MSANEDKINLLLAKLEALVTRQANFSREINQLRAELNNLKSSPEEEPAEAETRLKTSHISPSDNAEVNKKTVPPIYQSQHVSHREVSPVIAPSQSRFSQYLKSDFEKFIGENLINKIGIAILIIGVAIGVKYSIDHDLITPLTRIILGYLMGSGLLALGIKLKKNYENYSAVLVSGSIAIMYFITYTAYSFYGLFPQLIAFILMVALTVFAVFIAIHYNRQVIAHIGLVGAYAVPFLLSDNSGDVIILFSYVAIINIGILFIAFKKYWKPIYWSAFILTWIIFLTWFNSRNYFPTEHFGIALIFISIFFSIFYIIFLAYKLIQKEKFQIEDIILLLANAFIFFGLGYEILKNHEAGKEMLGLFTFCNALIHSAVGAIIYRQKLADRNLFYLVSGLALVFITITFPVQLNGNWVTLLWVGEAALLFWIGRTKNIAFYEKISYVLMLLSFFSIIHNWSTIYSLSDPEIPEIRITPLLNINFLSALLFLASFGFINFINRNPNYQSPFINDKESLRLISFFIPAIFLIVLYFSLRIEISTYWNQLINDSVKWVKHVEVDREWSERFRNFDLNNFKTIWIINYSLLFMSVLSFVNIKKFREHNLGLINLLLNSLVILVFLTQGLYILSELRDNYLNQSLSPQYQSSIFNIGIRYISYSCMALILFSNYSYIKEDFLKPVQFNLTVAFDILLFTSVIWMASSELITWLDIAKFTQSDKLGLSILWGVYALFLIALGIWKKKKHLRIGAIALFTVTLVKLFFYDISHLDTISKTIVFVILGILLLIISFLYNKFKQIIF
jgi:uncharacterized membrane protein